MEQRGLSLWSADPAEQAKIRQQPGWFGEAVTE